VTLSAQTESTPRIEVVRLGRMPYAEAFELQKAHHAQVLEGRGGGRGGDSTVPGRLLLVEHDPVITLSRRASASDHLLATPEMLAKHGVALEPTDRGGDITYHGPGQLVAYPIVDLNALRLRLHDYLRALEEVVIRTVGHFGVQAVRDCSATGVWVPNAEGDPDRKIGAMGVRVRRWVTMHGLSLNVSTNLEHFGLIVPCGLPGRPVTSLNAETKNRAASLEAVADRLVIEFAEVFGVETEEA
jgi:lipoyl(octanoyl) transferase